MKRSLLCFCITIILLPSCTIAVETIHPSEIIQFEMVFSEPYLDSVEVKVYTGVGISPTIIKPTEEGVYCIETPTMRGGYTMFLGHKSNIHDPKFYEIILIDWLGLGKRELSINDLKSLSSKKVKSQEFYQLDQLTFLEIESPNMVNYPKGELQVKSRFPKSGVYLFDVVYGEWDGKSIGKKVDVVIFGSQVRIISITGSNSGLVRQGEVIEEGELVRDENGNWMILDNSIKSSDTIDIDNCLDKPSVIDFINKRYIKC